MENTYFRKVLFTTTGAAPFVFKTTPLKIYTVYSPPNHADGTVHKTRVEAAAAEGAKHPS